MKTVLQTALTIVCCTAPLADAAERSTDCQDTAVPDLSRFGFVLESSDRYEPAELGIGSTYQSGYYGEAGFVRLSLFVFDLGLKKISERDERGALSAAYREILRAHEDHLFDRPTKMSDEMFDGMGRFLTTGFYMGATNPAVPLPEFHAVGVGQFRDCLVKIRATKYWDGGLESDHDLDRSLKLFRQLSRRLQQQVHGATWKARID